ncbi:MAG: PAS domain-containing protein [Gammaproteobacteria bacterium]
MVSHPPDAGRPDDPHPGTAWPGVLLAVGGAVSFLGWVVDQPRLTDWFQLGVSIQPNAALVAALSGVGVLLARAGERTAGALVGGFLLLLGALTLIEHLPGLNLGIDTLLTFDRPWGTAGTVSPGRMWVPASLSWTLVGAGLVLASRVTTRRFVPIVALPLAGIASLSLAGYLFGADVLTALPRLTTMAFQTSLFILLAALALVISVPEREPMLTMLDEGAAASLARRSLPFLAGLPVLIGYLGLKGNEAGLYDTPLAMAAVVVALVALTCVVVWRSAVAVRMREAAQRQMQARAFRSDQQAQTVIRQMPGGVFMVDRDFRYVIADGAELRNSPLATTDLVGRTLDEVLDPAKAALFKPLYAGALAGKPFTVEDEEGERMYVTRGVPLRGEEGDIYAVLAISHEITARKRAERAVEAAARQLQLVTDVSPVLLAHCDEDVRYKFVNRAYAERFGLTPGQIIGRTLREVVGEAAFATLQPHVDTVLAGTPVQFEVEIPYGRGMGTQYIYAAYTPEFDAAGRVVGLVAGILNITDRRRAEQALRDADRRKDEFLATLAHELRNPLAPISNSIDILERASSDPLLVNTARGTLRRQVTHMVKLVDDLLDVARINRNKLELRREPVTLSSVLQHALETCRPLADAAQQRLTVSLPTNPVVIDGDPVRLSQVFSNLLTNASRYNHPGGTIDLSAVLDGAAVEVRVRDSGIGLPAEKLEEIFELFSQLQGGPARDSGGLGIGLSLVRRLVELHGGTVSANSEGPGRGSEFIVRLPVVPPGLRSDVQPEAATPATAGLRLLVVDDNVDSAESLALLLELSGHAVRTAHNGPDALAAAATQRPHVVILDLGLPGMSGYEVCQALRREAWGSEMLVVALTGWGQASDRAKTTEAGFDTHLVKPVDPDALAAVIRARFPPPESAPPASV